MKKEIANDENYEKQEVLRNTNSLKDIHDCCYYRYYHCCGCCYCSTAIIIFIIDIINFLGVTIKAPGISQKSNPSQICTMTSQTGISINYK